MAEKTVGMRLKEEVERIGNCARNSEDVFNVADAVWREIDNRQDRIAKLEQTIDGLCAANEQANALLGAEIERRELAEAVSMRLAALVLNLAAGEIAPNITERTTQRELVAEIEREVAKQAADALRKDGEAK